MNIHPSFEEFERLSADYSVVPDWTEIFADLETPVTAFLKMRRGPYNFLLESAEQEEKTGRYSFLGTEPELIVEGRNGDATVLNVSTGEKKVFHDGDPLKRMEEIGAGFRQPVMPGIPRFNGGFIGYFSYDYVRHLERLPESAADSLSTPSIFFMLARNLVVFDHFRRKILLISNAVIPGSPGAKEAYARSVREIGEMKKSLDKPLFLVQRPADAAEDGFESNCSKEKFMDMVVRAKEYIAAGDVIQVVLSQRWKKKVDVEPFTLYRALRSVNPSPYMFYLETGEVKMIGSSPEILVKLQEDRATVRPIAGTRPRGADPERERAFEQELLQDEKEKAEHIMLVDLGRNDLGRVCRPGSVTVTELMRIEKYSHVMHLVSNVEGTLLPGGNAYGLLRASFPAGTVTGAPKVRAMEIIEELEGTRRGPYAGAVGYISFQGDMDVCITIRTMFIRDDTMYVQVGAGMVADSIPEREYEETVSKGKAMMEAHRLAREIAG